MSTEAGSVKHRGGLVERAHRLLEAPALFDLYQIIGDGGKRKPVSRFLEGLDYQTVIDLGCGTGAWSYLTRGRYLGLDFSKSFVEGCKRRFKGDARKSFQVGNAESIPFDGAFDLALLMSVLHHLSDEQATALLAGLPEHANRLLVMDLMPISSNPLSRLLYHLDRGDYIRSADRQREVLLQTGKWVIEREDTFYSYNRLYRHTLFLLRVASIDALPS